MVGTYENLPEQDKSQFSKETYKDIKRSFNEFLYDETSEFPNLIELLKDKTIAQYTLAELHMNKPMLMPPKAEKYLKYIGDEFLKK